MKASQVSRPHWFSRMKAVFVWGFATLMLFNACTSWPTQAALTSTESMPTESLTPSPTITEALLPTATSIPNSIKPALPTVTKPQSCTEIKGKVIAGEFESLLLGKPIYFKIYLPACYEADPVSRFPVLYLLHGLYTNETQWEKIGVPDTMDNFVDNNDMPFIIVMPRVPDTDAQAKSPILQVIPEELVEFIDSNYSTKADRGHRAIGGVSRGASLALRIGFNRRDLFGKVGMHSLPMLTDESTYYASALGKLEQAERPLLFIDSGNNDRDLLMAQNFDLELTKLAIPHTWYMFSGYHNVAYWNKHLPVYLEWYAQDW